MIANDFGYERTFGNQLYVYANSNDLLITISCSGTSPNIVCAKSMADMIGMKRYEFEVFGKEMNYEKLEDKHLQLCHKIKQVL